MKKMKREDVVEMSTLRVEDADLSGVDLSDLDLSNFSFYWCDLRKANFSRSDLSRAYLTGCDARGANLTDANIRSIYICDSCDLRKVRWPGSVPVIKDIDKEIARCVLTRTGRPKKIYGKPLLDMSEWHCGTSHCRAGWASILSGKTLEETLESKLNIATSVAATILYSAARPTRKVPNFYQDNDQAIKSIMQDAGWLD